MSNVVLTLLLTVAVTASVNAGPLHASCKIKWIFGIQCSDVKQKIVNQFEAWRGPEGCKNGGEKCLYTLTSQSDTEVKGVHETPVKHYKDDLTFTMKSDGDVCNVDLFETNYSYFFLNTDGRIKHGDIPPQSYGMQFWTIQPTIVIYTILSQVQALIKCLATQKLPVILCALSTRQLTVRSTSTFQKSVEYYPDLPSLVECCHQM